MDIKEYLEGFRKVKIAANRQLDRYYINKYGVIIALKIPESIVNIRIYLIENVCSKV